jgi:hypothetical protein
LIPLDEEALARISRAGDLDLEASIAAVLREAFPDAAARPPGDIARFVAEQRTRAGGHGFDTPRQIAVYCVVGWVLGDDFDTAFPSAADILADASRPPDHRIGALNALMLDLLRAMAVWQERPAVPPRASD